MDPITQALNVLGKMLDFGMMVYAATPEPLKAQGAADWATFTHNIATRILDLQSKVAALQK